MLLQLRLGRIELRNFIGGDDRVDDSALPRVKAALSEWGLRSTLHAPWRLNLSDEDPRRRRFALDQYLTAIDLADGLGSDVIVFHGGWHADRNRGHAIFYESASELLAHARGSSVTLALENDEVSRPTLFQHPHDFAQLDIADLRFTLDIGHAHTLGYSTADFIPVMDGRIAEVHLHDNDGSRDGHMPLGQGSIELRSAFSLLKDQPSHIQVIENYSPRDLAASVTFLEYLDGDDPEETTRPPVVPSQQEV